MTAGNLDQFITIERKTRTANLSGGFVETWSTWKQVWAGVKAKAGRESIEDGRTNATFVFVFTVYTLADLSELDRIVWNGERYNIRGMLRAGARALHTKFEAERGVAS